MTKSVYEIMTKKIIAKLEEGLVPWRQPWTNSNAANWKTQKPYRGINVFLVEPGEDASKKQILEVGGRIKIEELKESQTIVYWFWKEKEDEGAKEKKTLPNPFITGCGRLINSVPAWKVRERMETFDHDPINKRRES